MTRSIQNIVIFVIILTVSLALAWHLSQAALNISSPTSIILSTVNIATTNQTATSTVDYLEASDDRGEAPGWSATMNMTHLTVMSLPQTINGSHSISLGGRYDGTYGISEPTKKYYLIVTQGGSVGTAQFKWNVDGGAWNENIATTAAVTLEKNIQVNFSGNYDLNDEWTFAVDVLPYTDLYVTLGTITAIQGSLVGVSGGANGYLIGTGATSNNKTLMSAEVGYGTGVYRQVESLDLNIHSNSLSGTYLGTVTFSVL